MEAFTKGFSGEIFIKSLFTIALIVILSGCAIVTQPIDPGETYRQQMKHWQLRINAEGFTDPIIDGAVMDCISVAMYQAEPVDHWKTYQEMLRDNFHGDCEDIAALMYGTLRRLGYPDDRIYIRLLRTLTGDHAVIRVKMPSGAWMTYDTTPGFGLLEKSITWRICDFNEHEVIP